MGKTRNTFIDVPERQMLHIPFNMQILISWFSSVYLIRSIHGSQKAVKKRDRVALRERSSRIEIKGMQNKNTGCRKVKKGGKRGRGIREKMCESGGGMEGLNKMKDIFKWLQKPTIL